MATDFERAKTLLSENNYTCVLCKGEEVYTSTQRGVKPLIEWVESEREFKGFSAADKIVGKAAAMLYVLLGVHTVFAQVMSEDGIYTLTRHGITPLYDTSVKEIRNRTNTGMCPMEETVKEIDDPQKGMYAMKKRLEQMTQKR